MKQTILTKWGASAIVGLALALTGQQVSAATTTNVFPFDTGIPGWGIGWGGQSVTFDAAQDSQSDPNSGSAYIVHDWSLGDQLVALGWFSGSMWNTGVQIDLTTYTNVSFDIKWDKANSTVEIGTYNTTQEGLLLWAVPPDNSSWITVGNAPIPVAASNGWVHVNVPINPTTPGLTTAAGLGFKKWTGTPLLVGKGAFWVDNIKIEASPAPVVPPTLSLAKPEAGLNLTAVTGPYNRENIKTIQPQTWLGQGNTPVSYSFTVSKGVDGTGGAQFQTHIFLASNPGTETGPDWNEANCIFLDLESTTNGDYSCTFRYKTNQPGANSMMYNAGNVSGVTVTAGGSGYTSAPTVGFSGGGSGAAATAEISAGGEVTNVVVSTAPGGGGGGYATAPTVVFSGGGGSGAAATATVPAGSIGALGSIRTSARVGTWTLTFLNDTNITLAGPGGASTNLTISLESAQLFADPVYAYFGVQAGGNNGLGIGKYTVLSEVKITGTANALDDVFTSDSALNTNTLWSVVAVDPVGVALVPATAKYWLQWTVPDTGFSPVQSASLATPVGLWSDVTGPRVQLGGIRRVLIDSSGLPGSDSGYWALVKRTFTKLQILLPGETAAPGTLTGKTGTPTAQQAGVPFDIVVNAVDDTWHPIAGVTHSISLSSTDTTFNWPGVDGNMVNGTVTFDAATWLLAFGQAGSYTITATDTTDGTKTPDTSPSVTVTP